MTFVLGACRTSNISVKIYSQHTMLRGIEVVDGEWTLTRESGH